MDQLIDSHCHLTFDGLRDNVSEVLARAATAGVTECITVATDLADAERALAISAAHPFVYVAAGIHPHEAGRVADGWDRALEDIVARNDVYAVGETGLDYHYDFSDREAQLRVFQRQLQIAQQVGKPVVIHCREAQADALRILAEFPKVERVIFHCFTGSTTEAEEILDRGYWISLTGVVTFKRSEALRAVARMIPADRLVVETDSPYLSPEPVRNVRPNEPAHVVHVAACIARQRGIAPSELAALATANTRRFFSLPAPENSRLSVETP